MKFRKVLDAIGEGARTATGKGERFERLMLRALPLMGDANLEQVMRREDLTPRQQQEWGITPADIGTDLIGFRHGERNRYVAIQCKCYGRQTSVTKTHLDAFLAWGGKEHCAGLLWVDTSRQPWSKNLLTAVKDNPKWQHIDLRRLEQVNLDWEELESGRQVSRMRHTANPSQQEALDALRDGYKEYSRGQCIMACGTGKTLVGQRHAEESVGAGECILVLVPSLALLSQTLRAWVDQWKGRLRAVAVCSDEQAGRDSEDLTVAEVGYPVTRDPKAIAEQVKAAAKAAETVAIFSTYHSSPRVGTAQKEHGMPPVALAVVDEAHHCANPKKDESYYQAILKDSGIAADRRLFMTATPTVWTTKTKGAARNLDVEVTSMDEPEVFGPVLYTLGFPEAVDKGLICDIRVIIMVMDTHTVANIQGMPEGMSELNLDLEEATKLTGVYNALHGHYDLSGQWDAAKLERAVFFWGRIQQSKKARDAFSGVAKILKQEHAEGRNVEVRHVDGTTSGKVRQTALQWLGADPEGDIRVLTNAKCLTEGVDVPALDGIAIMTPRKSPRETVQMIGRITRKDPAGKKEYGYLIIPLVVRAGEDAESALRNSPDYATLYATIAALRSHDERFETELQQLALGQKGTGRLGIGRGGVGGEDGKITIETPEQLTLEVNVAQFRRAIVGKAVTVSGSTQFWGKWGREVGKKYADLTTRIQALYETKPTVRERIDQVREDLASAVHRQVGHEKTIQMLAQHQICRKIFTSLFGNEADREEPPVAVSLQRVMDTLESEGTKAETDVLDKLYASVSRQVKGIHTASQRQEVMRTLYDKFFREAFPEVKEMGIAFTPVELIDYLLLAAERKTREISGGTRGLRNEKVHIMDPFSGTGTVLARLLGNEELVGREQVEGKWRRGELHSNEVELLAYYVGCANVEQTYTVRTGEKKPFQGAVLTNTFEEVECRQGSFEYDDGMEENRARRKRQRKTRINVITGNPPWSVSKDESVEMEGIKARVRETYAARENCTRRQKAGMYDKYILAMRWATDKLLASGGEGVMAFVTNAGWVGGDAAQGVRRCMSREFADVEILDLRGNANTAGEVRSKEGANAFGQATKTPVCLVTATMRRGHTGPARVKYHGVENGLSLQEKLKQVKEAQGGENLTWAELSLDEHGDWLNQRNDEWEEMVPLGRNEVRSRKQHENSIFRLYSRGIASADDGRVYASTRRELIKTMPARIEEYNRYAREGKSGTRTDDESLVKWHRDLQKAAEAKRGGVMEFDETKIREVMYRPFITKWVYFEKGWCAQRYQLPRLVAPGAPRCRAQRENPEEHTRYLCVGGQGEKTGLTVLMTRDIPDLGIFGKVQVFAEHEWTNGTRKSNIVDWYMNEVRRRYPSEDFTRSDVFNFVYGRLHDPAYRGEFKHESMKDIARMDWPENREEFAHWSIIGRELSELHVGYEEAEEYALREEGEEKGLLEDPWKWGMPDQPRWLDKEKKTRLKWNRDRVLVGFPAEHIEWRLGYHDALTGLVQGLVNNPRDAESKARARSDPEFWTKMMPRRGLRGD